MDYETRPTNRIELRLFAKLFRSICGLTPGEPINPLLLLERLPDLEGFRDVRYIIVYDYELPENVPARCVKTEEGYLIEIKETVYEGAYKRNQGGYRDHITHEIVHPFADKLGFKPIFSRQINKDEEIPAYRRLEWIVMALTGEIMMPYEFTKNMSAECIMAKYGVSRSSAEKRLKY